MTDITALLAIAVHAAESAGKHVLSNLCRRGETDSLTRQDVKHRLDVEAQQVATAAILDACPDFPILGEETCTAPLPDAPARWVIDPIDGTINFFHGSPWWCCSVALQVNGRSIAGAVYAPQLNLLFKAADSGPALCNEQRISVSGISEPALALVHTAIDKSDLNAGGFKYAHAIAAMAQRVRISGAAALDMCMVAAGNAEAFFESGIYLWDIAAASLILERAGGRCEILRSQAGYRMAVLASNGRIHSQLRQAVVTLLPAE